MSYSRRELYAFGESLGESVTRKEGGRIIYGGGGGGGGSPAPEAPPPPPPSRMTSAAPPPVFQTYGSGNRTGSLVQAGGGMRPSTLDYSKPIYDPNYADNITGYQDSSQFYQPIYQPQYQNYNMGNPMSISQYGQQPSYGGSYGGGFGGGFGGGYGGGYMPQMQTPFNPYMNQYQSPFSYQQPMQQAQPNYGPSQAIVGRSSQMRGTPNVMRRAEGGIASLMDDVE
jgi:hypothetical protein